MTDTSVRFMCARCGVVSGFLVVILGAFGAHALRNHWGPASASVWQTAVLYQMFHALALLALAGLPAGLVSIRSCALAGGGFTLGSLLFSGSLYLLAATGVSAWGMLTPVGGLLFLAGWGVLAVAFWRAAYERE